LSLSLCLSLRLGPKRYILSVFIKGSCLIEIHIADTFFIDFCISRSAWHPKQLEDNDF